MKAQTNLGLKGKSIILTSRLFLSFFFLFLFLNFVLAETSDDLPIDPIAICQDFTAILDFSGTKTISPLNLNGGSFDPDGNIVNFTIDKSFFTCDDLGVNMVTLTVEDNDGNTASCTVQVTVVFPTQTLACFSQLNVSLDVDGVASISPLDILANPVFDPCNLMTVSPSTFDCSDIGAPIFVVVEDGTGNSCFSSVNIEDKIPLEIIWPEDIIQNCTSNTDPSNTGEPLILDNCDNFAVSYGDQIFPPIGNIVKILRTWEIIDWNTLEEYIHVQIIENQDFQGPTAICVSDINLSLDAFGNGVLIPEDIDAGSFDDCGDVALSLDRTTFDCADVGQDIVVFLTVTDESGNTNQCWSTVTVEDKFAPTAICNSNVNISLGADGTATITPDVIDAGSTDNCGPLTYELSQSTFDCEDIGEPIIIFLSVTDPSGNLNQCWTEVMIEDKTPPVINCPSDVTLTCSSPTDPVVTGSPEIIENCDLMGFSFEDEIFPQGGNDEKIIRTWTIINWNTLDLDTCIQHIDLIDVTGPDLLCLSNLSTTLNSDGLLNLFPEDLIVFVEDDCGEVTLSIDKNEFDCQDIGNDTILVTAVDENGNASSCTVAISIFGLDNDGDGFTLCDGDCNDNNASVSPGLEEICGDNLDNNCNGETDEGCICVSLGQSTLNEWIESVSIGGSQNISGNDNGYEDYTDMAIEVFLGSNNLQLIPGFSGAQRKEFWSVWIDFNHNDVFDMNEEVFNESSKKTINGSFDIPPNALPGFTTMRISMKFNGTSEPCEIFPEGEVEDYLVDIKVPFYCMSSGQNTQSEWINRVQMSGLNNVSGDDGGYGDYTSLSASVNPGQNKNIKLKPGFLGSANEEYWKVWVDWNEDGDFEDTGELEVEIISNGNVTGQITVPINASGGEKRMRISMKNGSYADPCEVFANGEVEDYILFVNGNNPLFEANKLEMTPQFVHQDETKFSDEISETEALRQSLNLSVHPNPAMRYLNVTWNLPSMESSTLFIFDEIGQMVYKKRINEGHHIIDISSADFDNGVYLLQIRNGDVFISKRVIILKQ